MRTTLDIDDDILEAAKVMARRDNKTAGRVLSDLARKALTPKYYKVRNGVPVLPRRPGAPMMTTEDVRRILDEEANLNECSKEAVHAVLGRSRLCSDLGGRKRTVLQEIRDT